MDESYEREKARARIADERDRIADERDLAADERERVDDASEASAAEARAAQSGNGSLHTKRRSRPVDLNNAAVVTPLRRVNPSGDEVAG